MEKQKITALVALDLSAAFDMVNHNVLLNILHNQFRITRKALNWCDTYLRPFQCYVEITGSRSQPRSSNFTVPQGSCARPVLYSAYASSLQTVIPEGVDVNGFADDHNVKKSFGAGNKVVDKANRSVTKSCTTKINEWMNVKQTQNEYGQDRIYLILVKISPSQV